MTSPSRAQRADSVLTQERILRAAEKLFSERGYSGTSLRAIAEAAQVNLAAANYHFGSKEKLLEAAFLRCTAPINNERLRRLVKLEAHAQTPSVADIVRAFVEPGLTAALPPVLPQLLARLFAEPKSISVPLLEKTFRPVASRFFATLNRALPDVASSDLRWRFHFLVGAMIHLSNFNQPLNVFGVQSEPAPDSLQRGTEQLIHYVVAGLCQRSSGARL